MPVASPAHQVVPGPSQQGVMPPRSSKRGKRHGGRHKSKRK